MPSPSAADFQTKVNAKLKSSATTNADGTLSINATYLSGAQVSHPRVVINTHTQTVMIGDGSGMRVGDLDAFLNSLK